MAHRSETSDNGCLTIRLATANRTYFDSNVQFLYCIALCHADTR